MTERAVKSHDMEGWSWSKSKCESGALDGAAEGMRGQKGRWIWGFPVRAQLLCPNEGLHPTAQGGAGARSRGWHTANPLHCPAPVLPWEFLC